MISRDIEKSQEQARRNRIEIIDAKLTRRDMIRYGLLTAGGALVAKSGLSTRAAGASSPTSPPTPAFVQPLPTLKPLSGDRDPEHLGRLTAVCSDDPTEVRRVDHQLWSQARPQVLYDFEQQARDWTPHPRLPKQKIWSYADFKDGDGEAPHAMIHARYGEPVLVRNHNKLDPNHKGYGNPQVTTHLHNAHSASESDGNPIDYYAPGLYKTFHYPNMYAGGDPNEALGFLWFHDHCMDYTAQNVYRGLVGAYLLYDEIDSGNEEDLNPAALRLPSGEYDQPLVFGDKVFDPKTGIAYFDLFNLDGILGDRFLVNGKIQPFYEVKKRRYRFRILNSGPSRFYQFRFSNGMKFWQVSNDGNLLPMPVERDTISLAVAERVDIVVDFANVTDSVVYLVNVLEQTSGTGPTGKIFPVGQGIRILQFRIGEKVADPSRVLTRTTKLRDLPSIDLGQVVKERNWTFNRRNGAWVVNGEVFNRSIVNARCKRGSAEIWNITNASGGWAHPIHMHYEEFQILSRNGVAIKAGDVEKARKDVIWLHPNETVRIFVRFRDFLGKYPLHCHNVVHEDHAMMARYDIVDGNPS
ncbi:multicopper oxidase domain-containing protein (plasmid) [Skermanella mucosa]|uniref:multicopper oxidase family protein n=1 Tax=Skermanella mucosa TaxID=1789672 RepID=UPI00192B8D64|nr:multicopper oxidase domain-containing protein [Skermanella mucosa]UEM25272.1 multicopper oxidase domain-containing protein [Skermanella mucosa]